MGRSVEIKQDEFGDPHLEAVRNTRCRAMQKAAARTGSLTAA